MSRHRGTSSSASSKLRMDRQPALARITDPSLPAGKRKEIDNVMKKARASTGDYYWDKKLIEVEEKDPNRWRHSGYKKLYIEGESSGSEENLRLARVSRSRSRERVRRSPVARRKSPEISMKSRLTRSPVLRRPRSRSPDPVRRRPRTPNEVPTMRKKVPPHSPPRSPHHDSRRRPSPHHGVPVRRRPSPPPAMDKRSSQSVPQPSRSKRPPSPPPKRRSLSKSSMSSCTDDSCSMCSPKTHHRGGGHHHHPSSQQQQHHHNHRASHRSRSRSVPHPPPRSRDLSARSPNSKTVSSVSVHNNSSARSRATATVSASSSGRVRPESPASSLEYEKGGHAHHRNSEMDKARHIPLDSSGIAEKQRKRVSKKQLVPPEDPRLKVRSMDSVSSSANAATSAKGDDVPSKKHKSKSGHDKLRTKIKIEGEKRKRRHSSSEDSDDSTSSENSIPTFTATTRLTLSERFGKMAQWSVDRSNMENMRITKDSSGGALKVMIEEGQEPAAAPAAAQPRRSYSPAPAGHFPEELAMTAPSGLMSWDDVRVRYDYYKSRGYLRDLHLEDYIKWEEWWYRYQEWLKQERYYDFWERQQQMRHRRRKKIPISQRLN